MRPPPMAITKVTVQNSTQMPLVDHDYLVQAGRDEPSCLRRTRRHRSLRTWHGLQPFILVSILRKRRCFMCDKPDHLSDVFLRNRHTLPYPRRPKQPVASNTIVLGSGTAGEP